MYMYRRRFYLITHLQLVHSPDDFSLDPCSPGTCTTHDRLLVRPLYEGTTNGDHCMLAKSVDSE